MKIAIVVRGETVKGGGGAERRFARAFTFLCKGGSSNIYFVANESLVASLVEAGVLDPANPNVIAAPRDFSLLQYNRWVIQWIRQEDVNVIHLPLLQKSLVPLYLWLCTNRIHLVHTIASTEFTPTGKPTRWNRVLSHILFRRANTLDALYPSFMRTRWGKRLQGKSSITPCSFTDLTIFQPASHKEKAIVFAGRLEDEKNPRLLLEAVALLQSEHSRLLEGWSVTMLGDGPLRQEMENFVNHRRLESIVTIKAVPSTVEYLSRSQIFVSLQRTENYPSQSLLEAMASGNAIVATDVGDTQTLVSPSVGILVDGTPEAVAAALQKLIRDDVQRLKLGQAARLFVMRHHRVEEFCNYLIHLWGRADDKSSQE